jgi:hypothetical protein
LHQQTRARRTAGNREIICIAGKRTTAGAFEMVSKALLPILFLYFPYGPVAHSRNAVLFLTNIQPHENYNPDIGLADLLR